MSVGLDLEGRAALAAIDACNRLAPKLLEVMAQHQHAAGVARPDWTGPHHDVFEDRYASVQRALDGGRTWVLQLRHEAEGRLLAAMTEPQ
jgi:hypothetical protein